MNPHEERASPSTTTAPGGGDAQAGWRESLSALADGDAEAAAEGCGLWRSNAEARATWHAYHLIGDALRSDELVRSPARDAAFVAALRERLAAEPAVLAPMRVVSDRSRHGWLVPAAAAAGFAAVVGVLVVTRVDAPAAAGGAGALAELPAAAIVLRPAPPLPRLAVVETPASASVRPPLMLSVDGQMIRDGRLDGYLRAHREMPGAVPFSYPGALPRNVEASVTAR